MSERMRLWEGDRMKFKFHSSNTVDGVKTLTWASESYGYYHDTPITPGSTITFSANWFWPKGQHHVE